MAVAHHRGTVGEHAGKLITAIGAAIAIGAAVSIVGVLARVSAPKPESVITPSIGWL